VLATYLATFDPTLGGLKDLLIENVKTLFVVGVVGGLAWAGGIKRSPREVVGVIALAILVGIFLFDPSIFQDISASVRGKFYH